jgi:hypothetical protein
MIRLRCRGKDFIDMLRVVPLAAVLNGCFLAPWSPPRPDPASVSGPAVYVERCESCHATHVSGPYAAGTHSARGIRCGQCHRAGAHPDFTHPVTDASCGGCHQPEYQQTLLSKHFAARVRRPLDNDRTARAALRRAGFVATTANGGRFAGDASSDELGGRLCAACHYDEHRFGHAAAKRPELCTGCHAGRDDHFPMAPLSATNHCTECHVRVGETVTGQVVNTHRFAAPGRGDSEQ